MDQEVENVVLVHGAGSGPWVFDGWADDLPGVSVHAVDLHEGLDVAQASMTDYCDRVVVCMSELDRPTALCGWSMGGLVTLMASQQVPPAALVLLEPSPPGEVQGFDPDVTIEPGAFDAEAVYGRFPSGIASRAESSLARGERKRGISVPEVGCRTLVISGDEFQKDRGESVTALYGAEHLHFCGLTHWPLVTRQEVRKAVASFVAASES